MELILNDLVWNYQCKDKYMAIERIKAGVIVLAELRKQNSAFKLCSSEKVSGNEIAPNYYFGQLFHEREDILPQNYKTMIRMFLANFNKIAVGKELFEFDEFSSRQCGYAYANRKAVFSFRMNDLFANEYIEGVYENAGKERTKARLVNIYNKETMEKSYSVVGSRIYEANPKHKINYGWGSKMDLDEKEAQLLLNCAIEVDGNDKHLAAKCGNTYYSFRCHLKNLYHGYQDNNLPENVKTQLKETYTADRRNLQ